MPKQRIVKVAFGKDAEEDMWKYVENSSKYWKEKTRNFRENRLKEYARLYKGTPFDEKKTFPWDGASNTVVQLIATHCDQLLSRVMATFMIDPIWPVKIYGDIDKGKGEEQREALERFLNEAALDSEDLDLYRVEEAWASGVIRNGTGVIKFPWEYDVEKSLIVGEFASTSPHPDFEDVVKRDGPMPINVPLNKILVNTNARDISSAEFKAHITTYTRHQLQSKKQMGLWDDSKVDKICLQPDRSVADILQQYIEDNQGLITAQVDESSGELSDEYDLYECWFTYIHNGKKFRLVAIHHPHSKTRLIAFYNFYPDNLDIFEDAKLAYDDDQYYGYGFAEMLKAYQEEVSTMHNQRIDAKTLGNSTAFRVNKNSKLHSIMTFYPGVVLPADEGEIERLDTSNPMADNMDGENLSLALAKERTGIDPAIGGTGGGIVNQKRGIYSSQGTFAVLQQQNNRTGLRMSDMRSAHARAGRKFAAMYAHFGLGQRMKKYGDQREVLEAAFKNIKSGRLGISIRPATASLNKELEKQNDILLATTLTKLYQEDAQILQSLGTQGMPEDLKAYYVEVLKAKNSLMKHILRNFGHEDADSLIPVPAMIKEGRDGNSRQGTAPTQGDQSPFSPGFGGQSVQGQGSDFGDVPVGSGEGLSGVPS